MADFSWLQAGDEVPASNPLVMNNLSRRQFLKMGGLVAAAWAMPGGVLRWASARATGAADLTTLARTIGKGSLVRKGSKGSYYRLAETPGEPHLLRSELATKGTANPRSLLNVAHMTDIHLVDAQSPARVEFLDRFSDPGYGCQSTPFSSAFRPQEMMTLQVLESMIRQLRAISVSPVTGNPITLAVCTGDNIDNEQYNELRWFIDAMDGNGIISNNSGGPTYEGVQSAAWADPEYWHPDAGIDDKYKQQWGFPEYPRLFEDAVQPFAATGIGIKWLQTFGNHDGLLQGNAPRNAAFAAIAVGGEKVTAPPPGFDPCDGLQTLRDNPTSLLAGTGHLVTRDANRRVVSRGEYIAEMFNTTGTPNGHGFTAKNVTDGVAYWVNDDTPGFRMLGLDTVNPGGTDSGSIGQGQFDWLEQRLIESSSRYYDSKGLQVNTSNTDKLVILFSHHGLRSMNLQHQAVNPFDATANDFPRKLSDEVQALVLRFPNVIAWVNGHSHANVIVPRSSSRGNGFWDIGTAAHIDWSCQSRLIEVIDNQNGTLSIFCTMVDHAAPITPGGTDPVLKLASISRELAANDYQTGLVSKGPGKIEDRNVELILKAPFAVSSIATPTPLFAGA